MRGFVVVRDSDADFSQRSPRIWRQFGLKVLMFRSSAKVIHLISFFGFTALISWKLKLSEQLLRTNH